MNRTSPEQLLAPGNPGYVSLLANYGQEVAIGYTHLFRRDSILSLHYGWTNTTIVSGATQAGEAFVDSLNMQLALPANDGYWFGPSISVSNGYNGVTQGITPFGPDNNMDYHADWSKVAGHHTIGVGGMFYRLHTYDGGISNSVTFTQNATSQDATAGPTGFGPASFMLGIPDSYSAGVGNTAVDAFVNWYAAYAQDQWKVSRKFTITAGLRYDYVSPASFNKIVSALDFYTGQYVITGAVPPLFPQATAPSGFFYSQYNGYEPRFGIAYQALGRTVFHGAFAILDDHNNNLDQKDQDLRRTYPSSTGVVLSNLDIGLPTTFMTNLPTAASLLQSASFLVARAANPHDKIPYSMEFNAGIQQQFTDTMVLTLNYVGSLGRHQFIDAEANTALVPGPGAVLAREPFPQFGGPMGIDTNAGTSSYNALAAELNKSQSHGLSFMASYTWSKSMDISSMGELNTVENFYNLKGDWGPSTFNVGQLFVLSGVYALPVGREERYLSSPNRFAEGVVGDWNVGSIISLESGTPFQATVGDVANVGGGSNTQRAEEIGGPYAGTGFQQSRISWINKASFASPVSYTYGNERRNDLIGPPYKNVDFNAFKYVPLTERVKLQIRAEFFNLFNHTNLAVPVSSFTNSSFGKITSAGAAREIQFGAKVLF
jgi:hypothetical protein